FITSVASLIREHRIDVVVPVTDAACRALIPARMRLEPAVLAAPRLKAYERASHKGEIARLAPRFGLVVPESRENATTRQALELAAGLGWPVVLRPVESVARSGAGLRKRGAVRVANPSALSATWQETVSEGAALLQRPVSGRGEGIFVLRWNGQIRAAFAHR